MFGYISFFTNLQLIVIQSQLGLLMLCIMSRLIWSFYGFPISSKSQSRDRQTDRRTVCNILPPRYDRLHTRLSESPRTMVVYTPQQWCTQLLAVATKTVNMRKILFAQKNRYISIRLASTKWHKRQPCEISSRGWVKL